MLLFRVVPLLSIDEIDEIEQMQEIEQEADAAGPHTGPSLPGASDDTLVGATSKAHRLAGATGVLLLVALWACSG
jgi:HPt (histidine-containing phosphotransfer) domain-containing protein